MPRKVRKRRRRLLEGERVIVRDSWHSDILPGVNGEIVKPMGRGYAVEITAIFSDALGRRGLETRCLYFTHRALAPRR